MTSTQPKFNSCTSTEDVLTAFITSEETSLKGKTIIVTGATAGIGKYTAAALLAGGSKLFFTARTETSAQTAAKEIIELATTITTTVPSLQVFKDTLAENLDYFLLDFADLESVVNGAKSLLSKLNGAPIDILVNNAGVYGAGLVITKDGYESTIQINYLGPVLLTWWLFNSLSLAKTPRIVNVSSESHRTPATLAFDDLLRRQSSYFDMFAYGNSKLANILFSNEIHRRFHDSKHIISTSLHPGSLIRTSISRKSWLLQIFFGLISPFTKSISQGAATSVFLAIAPEERTPGGEYFRDCNIRSMTAEAANPDVAKRLWNLTVDELKKHLTPEILALVQNN